MITCPYCTHKELEGAIFCSQCGTDLLRRDGKPTSEVHHVTEDQQAQTKQIPTYTEDEPPRSIQQLTLRFHQEEKNLPVHVGMEITLGRISPGQSILPDVDLAPYGAYEAGVSRIHAKLSVSKNGISLMDLGSANGTRVNGKKIAPRTVCWLHDQDEISLGKLKFHIQFT